VKQRKFRASDFDGYDSVVLVRRDGVTTHISDGCWIVPIRTVKNAERFVNKETIAPFVGPTHDVTVKEEGSVLASAMRGVSPPFVQFERTGWTYRDPRIKDFASVAFVSTDRGTCFLAERYVKRFRIEEVYCTVELDGNAMFGPCFPSEPQNWPEFDLALMPVDLGGSGSWLFKQIRKAKKGKANG